MSEKIQLTIQFFGALRKYTTKEALRLVLPKHSSLLELREIIISRLKKQFPDFDNDSFLDNSVFANESQILLEDMKLEMNATITVLPPVCGG